MADITCRFSESVGELPLPEYPRPQFMRKDWLNLNGEYDMAVCKTGEFPREFTEKILVPFAMESKLSGVERHLMPDETLWYRRRFTVPADWSGKRILLHFGAVDYLCEVFINGKKAGGHRGGYNPFSLDITDYLRDGENELAVKVTDPTDKGGQQRGKQATATHGFWYTATSGIWQTVWLEPVHPSHLEKVKLTPDLENSALIVNADIPDGCELRVVVYDADEKPVTEQQIEGITAVKLPEPHLWTPEDPRIRTAISAFA